MPNPYGAPEISILDLSQALNAEPVALLVDVREEAELAAAQIKHPAVVHLPMSRLGAAGAEALKSLGDDKSRKLMVLCHHGMRSAQVTMWLLEHGWDNVVSVSGGIDRYALEIDPGIGRY